MGSIRFICLLTLLLSAPVWADEPLAQPMRHEVSSENQAFTAISSPVEGTWLVEKATGRTRWSMPGWFRWVFLADDGEHMVTGYDGLNLIPVDYSDDLVLLSFWRSGKKIREVPLKEIVPDKSVLVRTVSHYHWGGILGFNVDGELVVERRDGKQLRFDPATGLQKR